MIPDITEQISKRMLPGKPPTIWKFKKYSPKESNSQKKCQSKLEYILKLKMKNAKRLLKRDTDSTNCLLGKEISNQ